ncbi:hypothetical protein USDA257_c34530 [Sinorhizobium fredii USDA 257]|uniref:Uncharacterized protein n=1 Tax=Sinorhizobium fredii (strain USDA 257) TaxID=1185652 RepID=I3X806_SINF2|nr:hypothetical protein USDA257_c34530 [Sinorhizobium fredii USDA 257]
MRPAACRAAAECYRDLRLRRKWDWFRGVVVSDVPLGPDRSAIWLLRVNVQFNIRHLQHRRTNMRASCRRPCQAGDGAGLVHIHS